MHGSDQSSIQSNTIHKHVETNVSHKDNQSSIIASHSSSESSNKCKVAMCCNCCMCGYICLLITIVLLVLMMIIIYVIAPAFNHMRIFPQVTNVFIQLYDYGIGHDVWTFGNKSFSKLFMNATGAFAVEAYNPNFAGFSMHNWSLDALAMNVYQNKEQWGNVYCCSDHPLWNKSNTYDNEYNFTFDSAQWIASHETVNMSFVLFVNHLTEELFYMGWEASYLNDWKLNLTLHGQGWAKTSISFIDVNVQILMNCDITVNASYFFPFAPPTVRRIPPKKYAWQRFPVLDIICTFGIGTLRM